MISLPSRQRMLEVVQESLRLRVAPALSDREAVVTLGTIDVVLTNVLRRSDEFATMHMEVASIASAARKGHYGHLASLAAELDRAIDDPDYADDPTAAYRCASELLSRMIEADIATHNRLSPEIRQLLLRRSDKEIQICGKFQTVGKT